MVEALQFTKNNLIINKMLKMLIYIDLYHTLNVAKVYK